jgi:hypothetical protein
VNQSLVVHSAHGAPSSPNETQNPYPFNPSLSLGLRQNQEKKNSLLLLPFPSTAKASTQKSGEIGGIDQPQLCNPVKPMTLNPIPSPISTKIEGTGRQPKPHCWIKLRKMKEREREAKQSRPRNQAARFSSEPSNSSPWSGIG